MAFFALVDELPERLVENGVVPVFHHRVGDVEKVLVGLLAPVKSLQRADEPVGDCVETFQQQRVEHAAFVVVDHFERLFVGERLLVTALAGEGVVNVRDRDYLGRDGDLVSLESVGVAVSVPAFMMPAANLVGVLHQRFVLADRDGVEHLGAVDGVPLHDVELFGGELAGLVQNGTRDGDFPDVVHGRCRADDADVVYVDLVLFAPVEEFAQKHLGDGVDVQHVHTAFAVTEFYDVAEHGHHHAVVARLFVNLV